MKIVLIIPTYNERKNIGRLIETLLVEIAGIDHDMNILVVDDNSPDGTALVVRGYSQSHRNVHILPGKKRGLGAAYIRGMDYALKVLGADVIFQMDADFSHQPSDVPRLVREIEKGFDFVIGSRYVKGGTLPQEWGVHRRLNSLLGNFFTRHVAGVPEVRDCTAGFRAIRAHVLKKIDLDNIKVQGYVFQISLLYNAIRKGARVQEIPVNFINRVYGESKLGISDIVEFILNVFWIRLQASKIFFKFGLVGLSGVIVNLGSFAGFLSIGWSPFVSSPLAVELSIIWNFLFNNFWTFRDARNQDGISIRGVKFNVVSLASLFVSYSSFLLLQMVASEMPFLLQQAVSIIPATAINYFLNVYWTFSSEGCGEKENLGNNSQTEWSNGTRGSDRHINPKGTAERHVFSGK